MGHHLRFTTPTPLWLPYLAGSHSTTPKSRAWARTGNILLFGKANYKVVLPRRQPFEVRGVRLRFPLSTMATAERSYLIVGAGVFGVSTAYHLIRKYPNALVTIVDRDAYDADSRVAASWDWNKVVRADYDDVVYCRLGIEAQDVFKSDPLWQPFFHETGIYWVCRSDYARQVIANYASLGREADLMAVPLEEAKKLYSGLFADADYSGGVHEVLVNKTSGWAAAGDCLRAVTKRCLELGVKYVVADVQSLLIDRSGRCTGVFTATGSKIEAAQTILSSGAFTPKLLEQSALLSGRDELRSGDRILAGGITTGMTRLDKDTLATYKDMPVGVQGYTAEIGECPPCCSTG